MKFPRHVKRICQPMDMAPFAGVFFILAIFLALNTMLVSTPGLRVQLPESADVAGITGPTAVVVVDAEGNLYFDKQTITEPALKERLKHEVSSVRGGLTLVVRADKSVRYQTLARLGLLARESGVRETLLATKPTLARELEQARP